MNEALARDLNQAFEGFVLAYQQRLYGFVLRMVGDARDAEEVAQDAFVRAYRALQGYDAERIRALALRPWLYQIALNLVRNRVRKRQVRLVPFQLNGEEETRDEVVEPVAAEAEGPVAMVERGEARAALATALLALPQRYRAAVALRHVEGFGYAEIATVLEQPIGTVKANVHRGVALLRTDLRSRQVVEEVRQ